MSLEWCLIIGVILSIPLTVLYYSYGQWQYSRGRLQGFNDCADISLKAMREIVEGDMKKEIETDFQELVKPVTKRKREPGQ